MALHLRTMRRALVPIAGATAVAVLLASPVYADELPSKKPIYDAPSPPPSSQPSVPSKPTPTERLADNIGVARRFINAHTRLAQHKFDEAFSKYLSYEESVTKTIAGLAPPKDSPEQVVPGSIYVAVATMAGAIVVRNRNILIRGVTPLAVAVGAGWYFIPQTMENVGGLMWEYEKKVPAVAETHIQVRRTAEEAWKATRESTSSSRKFLDENVAKGRNALEELVKKG